MPNRPLRIRCIFVALALMSAASPACMAASRQAAGGKKADQPKSPASTPPAAAATQDWPSFRGPGATGVGSGNPPTSWNVATGENVRWKTPVPGLGHASPIVWGQRVFVATAVADAADAKLKVGLYGDGSPIDESGEVEWRLACFDLGTGKELWTQTACRGVPKVKRHPKSTHANSTPATDGRRVVAFFGSEGLYCYDLEGKPLWKADLGMLDAGAFDVPDFQWGFGSSPIIHDGRVIVQCDVNNGSFLAIFDAQSGRELRRIRRDEQPTWCTPLVHAAAGRTQIICNGYRHTGGYDFETGEVLWKLRGGGDVPAPSPFVADGLIFLTSAHGPSRPLYAVRVDARGDITPEGRGAAGPSRLPGGDAGAGSQAAAPQSAGPQTAAPQIAGPQTASTKGDGKAGDGKDAGDVGRGMAWWKDGRGAYMPTPIVYEGVLYVGDDRGVLTTYDAASGEQVYRQRLVPASGSAYSASPVAAGGHVYFTAEEGDIHVLKAGRTYEPPATVAMGEVCMATPAMAGDLLLVRTKDHLFCIGR